MESRQTTIPKILFPLNAKIRRNSASVCPPSRATREVLPFPNSGRFFHKRRYFFKGGLFFSGGVSRAMRLRCPPAGRTCIFFRVAAASVFRAARGGKTAVRGADVYFFEETHIPQLFPHDRTRLLQKKFRASERIGYQGTAIFAQPPRPLPDERARRPNAPADAPPAAKRPYPPNPSESPDHARACRPSCPHVACPSHRVRTLAQQAPTYRARLSVRNVRATARRTASDRPSEPAICQIRKCFRRATC